MTLADNILFDLPYIEERYKKTLEVCASLFLCGQLLILSRPVLY